MSIFALYLRVLGLLRPVWRGALALVLANLVLATTQFVEPLLLGKVSTVSPPRKGRLRRRIGATSAPGWRCGRALACFRSSPACC